MTQENEEFETWIAAVDEAEAKMRAEIVAGNSNYQLVQARKSKKKFPFKSPSK